VYLKCPCTLPASRSQGKAEWLGTESVGGRRPIPEDIGGSQFLVLRFEIDSM